ncbi:Na-translocating system protein MpsC family protein [Fictibacillus fluitans]|uniref:Na-translocating system protein MpsC family protein n=1 Tax=Fictibacillus fluitans TaxID=3058422 RepID=A0ABT8I1D0_9BACL|nr:Na-translocating system protein MpsC family protein [Fictibacillus sp. NE201]MDN4526831.1 Na-translocating system protein MpsC family protein [Fictibacillus sp. NE201]
MEKTQINNLQIKLGSMIGKMLRDRFGKGPESIFVTITPSFFAVVIKNFLSPMEQNLLIKGKESFVHQARDIIMDELLPEIREQFYLMTGVELAGEIYCDWNLHKKTGLLLAEIPGTEPLWSSDQVVQSINYVVDQVSETAQKRPLNISSVFLSNRLLLVKREGVLTRIESALIEDGFVKELLMTKKKLEKNLMEAKITRLEEILAKRISDIFVEWNFLQDKSYILIALSSK